MSYSLNPSAPLKDRHWLEQSFFLKYSTIKERRENTLRQSNINSAFHDTTLGGNQSINPKYQFTRTCDPKMPTLSSDSRGQGEYYNEAIDENAQRIWLQFGVMELNSLTGFLRSSYNYKQAYLANTGKSSSILFSLGQAVGFLATLPLQTFFGLNWLYRRATAAITDRPYSRFGYMKPTMGLYWTAATTMFNKLCANMGIVPGLDTDDVKGYTKDGATYNELRSKVGGVQSVIDSMPDTFKFTGNNLMIDLMAVSSKGQRLANQYTETISDIKESSSSPTDYARRVYEFTQKRLVARKPRMPTTDDYLKAYLNGYGKTADVDTTTSMDVVPEIKDPKAIKPEVTIMDAEKSLGDFLSAELRDGSAFVSFIVDNQGSITDTFSNTTKTPGIEEMINGAASQAKDMYVNFSGGNVGDGFIADSIETVLGGVTDLINGGLSAIGLGGLGSLGGGAFTEFNEVYDNSDAQTGGGSFTIKLSTPYANKISILQDIYAPLCMLLAGALPKATGKSSYSSPFVCRLYSPGRCDYKLAMIKSISITRGTSNIGWSKVAHLPTSIDVTLEIEDLNNVISMPIATGMIDDLLSFSFFDEDTPMSNYLSSLSGLGLYDQYYLSGKIATAWNQVTTSFSSITSPATLASKIGYSTAGEIAKIFSQPGVLDNR